MHYYIFAINCAIFFDKYRRITDMTYYNFINQDATNTSYSEFDDIIRETTQELIPGSTPNNVMYANMNDSRFFSLLTFLPDSQNYC